MNFEHPPFSKKSKFLQSMGCRNYDCIKSKKYFQLFEILGDNPVPRFIRNFYMNSKDCFQYF